MLVEMLPVGDECGKKSRGSGGTRNLILFKEIVMMPCGEACGGAVGKRSFAESIDQTCDATMFLMP
jgi:hypothetical protein